MSKKFLNFGESMFTNRKRSVKAGKRNAKKYGY